ncbi:DUF1152 domain-containing protein [Archaeoglobus veneficus]|uniref:DUF1152 domain-containing protein n=1 Tax=Archaeoglobus veneficus (strain DSM 11195 / SNP6) TaxID=693661 RepID=F2KP87_ARCVS|nr:DUF1152 domain-containing protein [Archaeoglobus veneficus]AEA47491.1 protein of unknown function DUF1152 [Archaeoglobus veneficus SNP6]
MLSVLEANRVMLIGIGGGGDVVSAFVIGEMLKEYGIDYICGGVVWERFRRDPKPGPRSIEEIENAEVINECLAWMKGAKIGRLKPIVAEVAEIAGNAVGVDITKGVARLTRSIREFAREEDIEIIIGVDAGGDALARGSEKGLVSPLSDALMIAALSPLNSIVAVVGFGSDGELSRKEIEGYLSELAANGGLIGAILIDRKTASRIYPLVERIETEASRVPLLAALGYNGVYTIWDGYEIEVSILNALAFFIDAKKLYELNPMAKAVKGCNSIQEANEALHRIGIKTELDIELELASSGRE